jgi:hypothetical protein
LARFVALVSDGKSEKRGTDVRNQNPPNLTLVVPDNTSRERIWILEPQGRNTFNIVVICCPKKKMEHPAAR